jgi:queuine tRNA-ribosyltransferase
VSDALPAPTVGFTVTARRGAARLGTLSTAHGDVATPAFVAVGTQGTVKGVDPAVVASTGTQVLFANTYHLYLRPGAERVAAHGGIHRFMAWDRPVMTDSGGFQVFSLGASIDHGVGKVANIFPGADAVAPARKRSLAGRSMVRVGEDSVRFRSHVDGSAHEFTPEISIAVQRAIGADVVLAFDECTSPLHDLAYTRASNDRTHRWAERSLAAFDANPARHGYPQLLYGIVQGGAFETLRRESARVIGAMPFGGMAIGGNLGRTHDDMMRVLDWSIPALPDAPPRHLLGIGDVPSILAAVARGIDTFDCVAPTRNARNGGALALLDDDGRPRPNFRLNLRNGAYADDLRPIEADCPCSTCARASRSYLRHLLQTNEPLGAQWVTVHNLAFMARLFAEIRAALSADSFDDVVDRYLGHLPQARATIP